MSKSKTKTEEERQRLLAKLDLPDGATLGRPVTKQPAIVEWAPEGIDPHAMPVTDIVFTPEMVEHFPDLSPKARNAASRYLFDQYKSPWRNSDRHSLLHHKIGEFLARVHKERQPGGSFVKEKIRLANTLAEHDITEDDLQKYIAWKASQEG